MSALTAEQVRKVAHAIARSRKFGDDASLTDVQRAVIRRQQQAGRATR